MNFKRLFLWGILCPLFALRNCKDEPPLPDEPPKEEERSVEQLNANILALRKLVDAKINDLTVQSCTTISDGTGYSVVLSDGVIINLLTKVSISSKKEEEADVIAASPKIGVKDEDNVYYWTLDGKWLLSEITKGDKIPVTGEQNSMPALGITEE